MKPARNDDALVDDSPPPGTCQGYEVGAAEPDLVTEPRQILRRQLGRVLTLNELPGVARVVVRRPIRAPRERTPADMRSPKE